MTNEPFAEQECMCGKVWRGKLGTNPAESCPDCGVEVQVIRHEEKED